MAAKQNTFEGGTDGTTVSAANSGGTSGDAFSVVTIGGGGSGLTFSNLHPSNGSLGGRVLTGASAAVSYVSWTGLGPFTTHYVRFYLYFTANPATTFQLFHWRSGANLAGGIDLLNTGKLRSRDSLTTQTAMTNSIGLNQLVRVEAKIACSATVGQVEIKLFNTATGSTPTETFTSTANLNTGANVDAVRLGIVGSIASTGPFWIDSFGVDSVGYPGPYIPTVAGNQATEADAANTGAGRMVAPGSQASSVGTANSGVPAARAVGSMATTTGGGQVGGAAVQPLGTRATEVDAANTGSRIVASGGTQVSESDTAQGGAASIRIPGGSASTTALSGTGAARLTPTGSPSTEADSAGRGGAVIGADQSLESETVQPGTPGVLSGGIRSLSNEMANPGVPYLRWLGAGAITTDSAGAGSPSGSPAALNVSGSQAVVVSEGVVGSVWVEVGGTTGHEANMALSGGGEVRPAGGTALASTSAFRGAPEVHIGGIVAGETSWAASGSVWVFRVVGPTIVVGDDRGILEAVESVRDVVVATEVETVVVESDRSALVVQ